MLNKGNLMERIRVLLIGDVVGSTGRAMVQKHLDHVRKTYNIDAVILNGENSAQGRGITSRIAKFFKHNGVDVITTGNHVWHKREIYSYINEHHDLLRPANFPSKVPGVGVTTFQAAGYTIGVINLQGRVFMRDLIDCPFRTVESILTYLRHKTHIIFIDMHAETTSEKMAMAHFVDGQVTGVVGTHTHVQTADERILPKGTAYITDLGMVGSYNSMLGMKKEAIIEHYLYQMPVKFEVDTSMPVIMCGVWIEVDTATGKATHIERVQIIDGELHIDAGEE
jgi:2',3'-cyclic-nucleotide 2'-phosphodiesterase